MFPPLPQQICVQQHHCFDTYWFTQWPVSCTTVVDLLAARPSAAAHFAAPQCPCSFSGLAQGTRSTLHVLHY
eukprot:1157555-Pelagomonas_calceolata.AAC.6